MTATARTGVEDQPNLLNYFTKGLEGVSMSLWNTWDVAFGSTKKDASQPAQKPSKARRDSSLTEPLLDAKTTLEHLEKVKENTILYLAYGSNLSAAKFQGSRGIRPLSSMNVFVPELQLTFDLPGIPYKEPCFANTRYREPKSESPQSQGLIGVVYEVTKEDYAKIIATEGGGTSYQDVMIDCYELECGLERVSEASLSQPFKAHTLFAPPDRRHRSRVGKDYAQPSARYLKLLTDGAAENKLPLDYQKYLLNLQPYTITTTRQKVGQVVFLTLWGPIALFILGFTAAVADKKGVTPPWAARMTTWLFSSLWRSYDNVFKPLFGDGERTEEH